MTLHVNHRQMIHMKREDLFSSENKKINKSKLLSALVVTGALRVKNQLINMKSSHFSYHIIFCDDTKLNITSDDNLNRPIAPDQGLFPTEKYRYFSYFSNENICVNVRR